MTHQSDVVRQRRLELARKRAKKHLVRAYKAKISAAATGQRMDMAARLTLAREAAISARAGAADDPAAAEAAAVAAAIGTSLPAPV